MNHAGQRFDRLADRYVSSEVHASSPTMTRLHALLDLTPEMRLCDVGCGAGHLGLSFAGLVKQIVAVDPAPRMLDAVKHAAQDRRVEVETVLSVAEKIPLPDATFDIVASRLAAHHFTNIEAAVAEMSRLTRPGGHVAVIDMEGYEDEALDAFNHQLEVWHDPTHGRSYDARRWEALFRDAGLTVETLESGNAEIAAGLTVRRWCEIGNSGEEAREKIVAALAASPKNCERMGITPDGDDFRMPIRTLLIVGCKYA